MKRIIANPAAEIPMEGLEGFYDEFKASRLEEMVILRSALDQGDFESLGKMAHKWKGFCEPYGFGELTVMSGELEVSAGERDQSTCSAILISIDEYLSTK